MSLRDFITQPWRWWRQTVTTLGLFNALLYTLDRLLARGSFGALRLRRYLFVAQPIGQGRLQALRPDGNTVVAATPPESPLLAQFPRPPQVIRARYANGAQCFSACVGATFAGFIWFQRQAYDEDEVRCRYVMAAPEDSVWDFDVHVEARFRLGRTLARLWQAVDAHLAAQRVQWSFSRISAFNPASIAAHRRLGTIACGNATFLCAGPLQVAFLSMSPFVHLSFSPRQRPSLLLSPPRRPSRQPH